MKEFEYINFRIQDLMPDALLLKFRNGYRFDPTDVVPRKLGTVRGNGIMLHKLDGQPRVVGEVKRSNYKILDHSWEPIELEFDSQFWELMVEDCQRFWGCDNLIVLTSELGDIKFNSDVFKPVHWFSHGYLCSEHWYRLYKDISIVTNRRPIETPWICANRLIDGKRDYRIKFLNMIDVSRGTYSLPRHDPQTNRSIHEIYSLNTVPPNAFDDGANSSAWITVNNPTPINTAFLNVVTETVIDRVHLTEKIFKPIVLKQPFALMGGSGCLRYLREYGFKTFDKWWSEAYDWHTDTTERMKLVAQVVDWVGKQDLKSLEKLRTEMQEVLEHNYNWFYNGFSTKCWDELRHSLNHQIHK